MASIVGATATAGFTRIETGSLAPTLVAVGSASAKSHNREHRMAGFLLRGLRATSDPGNGSAELARIRVKGF
jgi:hypothetical protein